MFFYLEQLKTRDFEGKNLINDMIRTDKWASMRENLSLRFPTMHDSIKPTCQITVISLRMLNLDE